MTKNKTAFVDFDGTIVDVFPRYYGILTAYLGQMTNETLDFLKYKKLKRLGKKDHVIVSELLNGLEMDIHNYVKFKRENLENFSWLKKDVLIGNPKSANLELKDIGYRIVLLTQRNNKDNLLKQLDFLNIKKSFDEVVMVSPKAGLNVKAAYLEKLYRSDDIIIGDSSVEIDASRLLNINGYFVESGLFSAETLDIRKLVFADYKSVVEYITNSTFALEKPI